MTMPEIALGAQDKMKNQTQGQSSQSTVCGLHCKHFPV